MGQLLNPTEFHRQYDEMISAFRRQIPDAAMGLMFSRDIDPFLRRCALGVWQAGNHAVTPSLAEYYNAICCTGNPPASILYWELVTEVGAYPGFSIPSFFDRMYRHDRETGRTVSQRFIHTFSLVLLLFAAVDGAVSPQEAAFIKACAGHLTARCDLDGLSGNGNDLDVNAFVTSAPKPAYNALPTKPEPETIREKEQKTEAALPSLQELLTELDELCGLEKVKKDVHSLINLVKVRKLREENGLPVPAMSLHMVFMGNPGTGKTTVARLLAKIYRSIGVLSKGQLVEVDRSGLVAGFVGQTALKTSEAVQRAMGGILFIDEAYALTNLENANDFGREAIEVILKAMEDHRKDFIVIAAGYTNLMGKFIASNPGLESRFNKYLYFDDYSGEQLTEIFSTLCQKNGYLLSDKAAEGAAALFKEIYENRDENFGNARDARNIFENALARQANRLAEMDAPTKDDLMTLLPEDLEASEDIQSENSEETRIIAQQVT